MERGGAWSRLWFDIRVHIHWHLGLEIEKTCVFWVVPHFFRDLNCTPAIFMASENCVKLAMAPLRTTEAATKGSFRRALPENPSNLSTASSSFMLAISSGASRWWFRDSPMSSSNWTGLAASSEEEEAGELSTWRSALKVEII